MIMSQGKSTGKKEASPSDQESAGHGFHVGWSGDKGSSTPSEACSLDDMQKEKSRFRERKSL